MYDMKNLTKLKKIGDLAPEAFKGFMAFDEAAFKDGAIPLKYKELIAVAVALHHPMPLLHRDSCQAGQESRRHRAGTGGNHARGGRAFALAGRSRTARTPSTERRRPVVFTRSARLH